ncbi:hypothetical protein [Actinomadura sp. WMMB 499]|uniref:hypothetical protein n=1 Tax=Actinomadura sp. WMMB 499 TaxID=1219491 RepID=UPI001C3F537E|nr:hypothetical protein [Actinomadura sp. WMMB 499]
MVLAHIELNSDRVVTLTGLQIHSTYAGFLEGYPNRMVNERLLASLRKRRHPTARPVHVIDPPRTHPCPDERPMGFGPTEELPPVYCVGFFDSARVNEELDDVLHRSGLAVVWFQDGIDAPPVGFVTAAVADLPWDDLAEDYEL